MQGPFEHISLEVYLKTLLKENLKPRQMLNGLYFVFSRGSLILHTLTLSASNSFLLSFLFTFQQQEFSLHYFKQNLDFC